MKELVIHLHKLLTISCLETMLPVCLPSYLFPSLQFSFLRTEWLLDLQHWRLTSSLGVQIVHSHPIKKTFLQISAHLGGSAVWLGSSFYSCPGWWQQDSMWSLLFRRPAEGQNSGSFPKMFPELFGYCVSNENIEMWRMANICSPFCQGTFTELITRRIFMIIPITIKKKKKGIHLRNKPLGSENKNMRTSWSPAYLCQILSRHQAIAQRNSDFQPPWVS